MENNQNMDVPFQHATSNAHTAANQAGPSCAASKRNRYEDYQIAGGSVKRSKSDGFEENACKPWAFNFKRHPEVVTISSDGESDDENYQYPGDSDKHNDSDEIETISCRPCGKRPPEMVAISSDGESSDEDYQNPGDSDKRNVTDNIQENRSKPRAIKFDREPEVIKINSESVDERPMPTQHRSASHKGKCKIPKKASCAARKLDVSERKSKTATSVIKEARAFKSEFPTCTIVMKPSYLVKGRCVHVPSEFSRHFLRKEGRNFVTLKDSTGKKWHVGFGKSLSSRNKADLYKGWYQFVLDNHLKVNDACVFELVDVDNLEMKVNIIRVSPDMDFKTIISDSESDDGRTVPTKPKSATHGGNHKISEKGKAKVHSPGKDASCAARNVDVSERKIQRALGVIKEAKAFKSEFPTCAIIMKPSYMGKGRCVHVPFKFARDFLLKADMAFKTTISDSESDDGRTMPTQQPKSASHGGNHKISKTSEVKIHCPGKDSSSAARKFQRAVSALKEARSFKSEFPTCTIILKPSYLLKGRVVV
ncbi:hypothetical protein MKX01_038714 [Papaver californicum]|nr:hypothetical protein MKX01_038714 [Papaver californicum]